MPLDPHAHLINQGWSGKGTGLRQGAINRPVIVVQKKTLSGIGKDRDEAFPFWDHVFDVAASAIKVKVYNDSDSEDTDEPVMAVTFQRTSTGIISNRRPTSVTPAMYSGTATPNDISTSGASGSSTPRLSIMAAAKQEAARRTLYSMFFRGPILGMDVLEDMAKVEVKEETVVVTKTAVTKDEVSEVEVKHKKKDKKRKWSEETEPTAELEVVKTSNEKRSKKGKEVVRDGKSYDADVDVKVAKNEVDLKKKKKKKDNKRVTDAEKAMAVVEQVAEDQDAGPLSKAERKRLKAEKKARKETRRKLKEDRRAKLDVSTEDCPPSSLMAKRPPALDDPQSTKVSFEASQPATSEEKTSKKIKSKDKDRDGGKVKKKFRSES